MSAAKCRQRKMGVFFLNNERDSLKLIHTVISVLFLWLFSLFTPIGIPVTIFPRES
jgi:hypothetical protein